MLNGRATGLFLALGLLAPLPACLQAVGTFDAGPPNCCSLSCVETTLACGLFPTGSPDYTCVAFAQPGTDIDSGSAIPEYAVDVCSAAREGEEVGCVAQKFPGNACAEILQDAGAVALSASLGAACPGGFIRGNCVSTCVTCRKACDEAGNSCNALCLDAGTYYGCLPCNAACNLAQAKCEAACTTDAAP